MTNTLNWAKKYLSLGWNVIPIKPRSKEPLIPWLEFQRRRATAAELTTWFADGTANLGVVTGPISNLVVVDLDGPDGLKSGQSLSCVSSVCAKTGNGRQVFYKWKDGIKNSVKKLAPGIDVRGDGGYVVVAPSIHPSLRMYRWERFVPARLPDFPQVLLAVTPAGKTSTLDVKPANWLSEALEELKNGHVHNTLISVLGKFRAHNFSISDTCNLLRPHIPADFDGLEEKIHEIWGRYEPNNPLRTDIHNGGVTSAAEPISIKSPANVFDFEQYQRGLGEPSRDTGIKSGFPTLDRCCEGGIKSERLFTIAARTGTGKTNFVIALARNLCEAGQKVLFFSTEFSYKKIWERYVNTLAEPSRFREHAFYVCDSFSPHLSQVEAAIKQVMPDVFIFDHINHLGEEREGLGSFMQGCNFLQRKYNTQGFMVAQLNRQADWVESGKRIEPRMSMIKGSGTIEQASSRVLLLSEVRVTPEFNEIIGVLDKNDAGDRGTISFALYKNPYHFGELPQ